MKEPPCQCKAGAPEWMVTFADLMSLLMTFFVLLLSFSNMEIVKFQTMAGSVRNAFGLRSEFDLSDTQSGQTLLPFEDPKEGDGGGESTAEDIVRQLEQMLKEAGLEENGEAKLSEYGATLLLQGDLLFDSGSAELKPKAQPLLDELAAYITSVAQPVDVVGHTDDIPISTLIYPSNWELSAARAGQAVRVLVEKGVPPRLVRAIGQAHTVPVSDNASAEGRGRNRRVEFVFTAPAGSVQRKGLDELMRGAAANSGGGSYV